jgi:hypothetical protein
MTNVKGNIMTNEIAKPPKAIDTIEGYVDDVEGEQEQSSGRLIQGVHTKFTNEAAWIRNDSGDELPAGLELIVLEILRVVVKWGEDRPIDEETRILAPGERWPDIAALNDASPKSEWREGPDGKMHGPWMAQRYVYMVDPQTMTRFTWPTSTTGGRICIDDIVDRTKLTRKYRGAHVFPVVTLGNVFMKTRFGGRQRPTFEVVRWIPLGDGGALPAPDLPKLQSPPTAPTEVKPPSAKEVTDDEIKW